MTINQLLKKLQRAQDLYGELPVRMECDDDVNTNVVAYVHGEVAGETFEEIRIADSLEAVESLTMLYGEDIEVIEVK